MAESIAADRGGRRVIAGGRRVAPVRQPRSAGMSVDPMSLNRTVADPLATG